MFDDPIKDIDCEWPLQKEKIGLEKEWHQNVIRKGSVV